ncbi:hypothetical protein [Pseudomonas sp. FEN]|nr:hypothetical protein [Pseudomonas sp. FEN]
MSTRFSLGTTFRSSKLAKSLDALRDSSPCNYDWIIFEMDFINVFLNIASAHR